MGWMNLGARARCVRRSLRVCSRLERNGGEVEKAATGPLCPYPASPISTLTSGSIGFDSFRASFGFRCHCSSRTRNSAAHARTLGYEGISAPSPVAKRVSKGKKMDLDEVMAFGNPGWVAKGWNRGTLQRAIKRFEEKLTLAISLNTAF